MNERSTAYLAAFIALFATSWSSIFIRLTTTEPLVTAFWRMLLSFLGMLFLSYSLHKTHEFQIEKKKYKFIFLSGFFLSLHFASWFLSLSFTSIVASVTIVDSAPLFVVIGGFIFLNDRINKIQLLGIFVSIFGGIFIGATDISVVATGSNPIVGDLLALIGAITVSGYFLIGRNVRQGTGNYAYMTWVYGVCTFFLFLFALIFNTTALINSFLLNISLENYMYFILLAIGPSLLGHTLYNFALKEIKAAIISVIILGEPVIASVLAFFILTEIPNNFLIIGAIFVLIGVGITIWFESSQDSGNIQITGEFS